MKENIEAMIAECEKIMEQRESLIFVYMDNLKDTIERRDLSLIQLYYRTATDAMVQSLLAEYAVAQAKRDTLLNLLETI